MIVAPFVIVADTREQRVPPMPPGVEVVRETMGEGDYTTRFLRAIAVVERKSATDFASSLTWGRERFDREIDRLQSYRWKAIVVEADLSVCCRVSRTHPNSIIGSVASFVARYDVPVLFAASDIGAGRLIAGLLRRWEERVQGEGEAA